MLKELKGKETVTKSGRKLHLYANIGSTGDVANVLANDAEGIGLFRSEFVYLEKEAYPTEEEPVSYTHLHQNPEPVPDRICTAWLFQSPAF